MVRFNNLGYLGQSARCKVTSSQHISPSWFTDFRSAIREFNRQRLELGTSWSLVCRKQGGIQTKKICRKRVDYRQRKINIDT